jgi:hypothetical protein
MLPVQGEDWARRAAGSRQQSSRASAREEEEDAMAAAGSGGAGKANAKQGRTSQMQELFRMVRQGALAESCRVGECGTLPHNATIADPVAAGVTHTIFYFP